MNDVDSIPVEAVELFKFDANDGDLVTIFARPIRDDTEFYFARNIPGIHGYQTQMTLWSENLAIQALCAATDQLHLGDLQNAMARIDP